MGVYFTNTGKPFDASRIQTSAYAKSFFFQYTNPNATRLQNERVCTKKFNWTQLLLFTNETHPQIHVHTPTYTPHSLPPAHHASLAARHHQSTNPPLYTSTTSRAAKLTNARNAPLPKNNRTHTHTYTHPCTHLAVPSRIPPNPIKERK